SLSLRAVLFSHTKTPLRRYGLQTAYTVALNAALIFVVLFYVYPLKFLFIFAVGGLSGGATVPAEQLRQMVTTNREMTELWLIYSAGVTAVYSLFALLYRYAYKKRRELELNEYETLCTRGAIVHFCGFAGVGVVVAIAALVVPPRFVGAVGFLFTLNAVWGWTAGVALGKRERRALERMQASARAAAGS